MSSASDPRQPNRTQQPASRPAQPGQRPAQPTQRPAQPAARLFEHRRPLYRQAADLTFDIRNKSFEDVSYLCAEMLLERGLL